MKLAKRAAQRLEPTNAPFADAQGALASSTKQVRQGLGTNLRDIALSGELLQLITMSLV